MQCPRCGANLISGNTFCHRCRTRVGEAGGPPPAPAPRPAAPATKASGRRWRVAVAVVVALGVLGGLGTTVILARRRTQRVEREAAAVSELRQVLHAEMAYAQANGGRYDRLQCLSDPAACIPRYPAGGPRFLGAGATPLEARQGYRFLFYSGPPPERIDPARASPSSLAAFAYVAVPDVAAGLSGRSFCTDASRRVCELKAQDPHALAEGACPLTCVDLR